MNISPKIKIIFGTTIVLLVLAGIGIYSAKINKNGGSEEIVYERGKPVIPHGIQTYEFLQSSRVSPRIRFLTVDPLDAKPGETQKFRVAVEGSLPVVSVTLDIEDDAGISSLALKKDLSGEMPASRYSIGKDNDLTFIPQKENPSSTIFHWVGERVVKNKSDSKFSIGITAKESIPLKDVAGNRLPKTPAAGNFVRIGVANLEWNKVCGIPFGGDWSSSESCAVSFPDGVDEGSAHIQNYSTVVLDADFGVNADKTIIFQPIGIVAVNTKAKIVQGNIWKLKLDSDGTKEVISTNSPGSSYKRRFEFKGGFKTAFTDINNKKKEFVLSQGRQVFQIASAAKTGPKIIQADINPLDVKVGDTQKLSLVIQSQIEIASVVARIETDKEIIELPLSLDGPTPKASLLEPRYGVDAHGYLAFLNKIDNTGSNSKYAVPGVKSAEAALEPKRFTYSGSWIVRDTHSTKYHTSFVVKDINGADNSILMAWSDPCGTFAGGNRALNTCSFSDVDGADNGNLTINTSQTVTLQNGATLAFNSGRTLTVNGAIAIAAGAQITQTNLWLMDIDGDLYTPSLTLAAAATAPANSGRAYTRYTSPLDCYDLNSSAFPDSSTWSDRDRGDYSFDFNCDGNDTPALESDGISYQNCRTTIQYPFCAANAFSVTNWCSEGITNGGICTNDRVGCGEVGNMVVLNQGYAVCDGSCSAQVLEVYQSCN
ncbi:MAG: hypothetical protein LiPW15_53 [Parcubacteria group bacterium LiPW_15]|nr:MAG: hypothetical protein LiPW15_53 [Parcubacteria group bacterium LiPW_15]